MTISAFGDAPTLPSWIRLLLGAVAIVHALLCARVVVMRMVRWRERNNAERVPTAAMVAYGVLTANIARVLLVRIPQGTPLVWESLIAYVVALAAGSIAFTQIVVYVRRSKRDGWPEQTDRQADRTR